jgi:hypothetical protein
VTYNITFNDSVVLNNNKKIIFVGESFEVVPEGASTLKYVSWNLGSWKYGRYG